MSQALKDDHRVRRWVEQNRRLFTIASALLAVIHPAQYATGIAMLDTVRRRPELAREPQHIGPMLELWCSPFSGLAVMCNRETRIHRDPYGRSDWYDILCTLGE